MTGTYPRRAALFTIKLLLFSMLLFAAAISLMLLYAKMSSHRAELPGGGAASFFSSGEINVTKETDSPAPVVIIDAGHGGADGGAVCGEIVEKELNLEISLYLRDLLNVFGVKTVMTRESDMMLDDGGEGKAKMRDLRARLAFGDEYPEAVFVSVHMNKFPSERVSGLQVYYSPSDPRSAEAAETIQNSAREHLDPQNKRHTKAAGSSIYILDNIKIPAVLVECGFISNPEEALKLSDEKYQRRLAGVISSAVTEFLFKEN